MNEITNTKYDILIVDDTPEIVNLLENLLDEQGYNVRVALEGDRAVASARAHPPDLILLDIMLPNANGFEVSRQLKSDERTRDVPIIFITALGDVNSKVQAFSNGGVDYIVKPIQNEELLARVQTHLFLRNAQKTMAKLNVQLQEEIRVRQLAEEALKTANEKLGLRVQEQTQDLIRINSELKQELFQREQAEKKLMESEARRKQAHKMEAVGTMAGGITHDFNKILQIILLNAEVALSNLSDSDPLHRSVNTIYMATLQGIGIVHQLLCFCQNTEIKKSPIKISSAVKESVKFFRTFVSSKIEIRQSICESSTKILADLIQIQQVLMNLFSNASDAMKDGKGVLEISLTDEEIDDRTSEQWRHLKPGRYVKLMVRDNGLGIAPDILPRIFDPYFTTKEPGKGTGMGLSVVHGIVTEHGGVISAESEPGKGSTFTILFPAIGNTRSESHPYR